MKHLGGETEPFVSSCKQAPTVSHAALEPALPLVLSAGLDLSGVRPVICPQLQSEQASPRPSFQVSNSQLQFLNFPVSDQTEGD